LVSINEVELCRAQLMPAWVTVLGWISYFGAEPAARSTQCG